jgi:hypothetical protein
LPLTGRRILLDEGGINLEFLTVTGPAIQQVKRHEVTVVEAPSL